MYIFYFFAPSLIASPLLKNFQKNYFSKFFLKSINVKVGLKPPLSGENLPFFEKGGSITTVQNSKVGLGFNFLNKNPILPP